MRRGRNHGAIRIKAFLLSLALLLPLASSAQGVFLEAEGFKDAGGWTNYNQSMMQMGSPYLIAHGLGRPVADASTTFTLSRGGTYRLWVHMQGTQVHTQRCVLQLFR